MKSVIVLAVFSPLVPERPEGRQSSAIDHLPLSAPFPCLETSPAPSSNARYRTALEFLYGRLNYERAPDAARTLQDFKLTRMEDLLAGLGNPQLTLPTVHIAGSKGKGSTASMIARIAEAAGYRVGLFTSPHVARFEERFTVNGACPTEEEVAALLERLLPITELMDRRSSGTGPTFFELATAMGWLHFADQHVDLAVVEVGLGGRLDSTNVCSPLVTAITSISRDHMRLLGEDLESIAREKAGIIKPGVPVVSGVVQPGPAGIIQGMAQQHAAPLYRLGHEIRHTPHSPGPAPYAVPPCYSVDYQGLGADWKGIPLGMPGEHQTRNATLAVAVAQLVQQRGFSIPLEAIRDGLQRTRCPLRVEVVSRSPLTIVDAAHNPASITALCESLQDVSARRRTAIFATSRDKETAVLLEILKGHFDEILLTRYLNNPRALDLREVEEIAARVLPGRFRILGSPQEALAEARRNADPADLVCVTGSFFLAAEARLILTGSDHGC